MPPLLVYDGRCAFCLSWIGYWKQLTGERVSYAPFQEAADAFPQVPIEQFKEAVQLMMPDGEVLGGAHAVFQTLAIADRHRRLLWAYVHVPGFAALAEAAYQFIARRRNFFWRLSRFAFGAEIRPLDYQAIEQLFLRALGLVYLIAFVSFGVQAAGLVGPHGILPAPMSVAAVTSAWAGGALCAVLVILGVLKWPALIGACVCYWAVTWAGQDFMFFQWDALLIETGFLAIFLGRSRIVVWLFRWLLFRLMFESGASKLLSGDPTWRDLTALTYHYQTQPLPTPIAWYMYQLPVWFHRLSTGVVLAIEVLVPFLIFAPRRLRHFAGYCLIGLQILIALTGNYAFFNLLALALCLFLFDRPSRQPVPAARRRPVTTVFAVIVLVVGSLQLMDLFSWPVPGGQRILAAIAPLNIINPYGLFRVMTTTRLEITVEGTNDGMEWRAYEFKFKPGPLDRRPPWVAPYQPRLDWQMWFAALGTYRENPWFINFLARLLQGSPEVLDLLANNPFPTHPPRFIRALVYDYRFTHGKTRDWWSRELLGTYVPAISLDDLAGLPILR